jgi:hypothetical protein
MQEPVQQLRFPAGSVAFDPDKIDQTIQSHGTRFLHYTAMFNPIGLIDENDARRPDAETDSDATNGLTYIKAGYFRAIISGNSKEIRAMEGGLLNSARAQITPQRYYEEQWGADPERVYLAPFDRLFLDNEKILVVRHELATAHETGLDRLRFPVAKVKAIVDSNGSQYYPDDYQIEEGCLRWVGKRPGINPNTGKGVVYSIRYLYRPYWLVDHLVHDLRLVQHEEMSKKETISMQQCAIINREYVYHSKQKDPERQDQESINAPADGGLSPK